MALAVWTRAGDEGRTGDALKALTDAMAWDERTYGREYDGDRFNIVAVDDFNFGAMENKGLNIFNSRYVLADRGIATDTDRDTIASIVAHEYFHNWSGNRVTCRDWFQLSLKEGFTVLRDQQFGEDLASENGGSSGLERVRRVRQLRQLQFPEDAGPLAHPIRPDEYAEISNFYTPTVYDKGAEVLRMLRTLIGAETFRRGSDLYFERHDGTAATCEDFLAAMTDAARGDDGSLPPGVADFGRWYSTAGTPTLTAELQWADGAARLTLGQSLPGGAGPLPLPIRARLFDRQTGEPLGDERLLVLTEASQSFDWPDVTRQPVLSLNRGFSAPVIVARDVDRADLALLAARDDDSVLPLRGDERADAGRPGRARRRPAARRHGAGRRGRARDRRRGRRPGFCRRTAGDPVRVRPGRPDAGGAPGRHRGRARRLGPRPWHDARSPLARVGGGGGAPRPIRAGGR